MPWYRSGTVSITSGQTTVTGTSTDFAMNARVGDAFQGPDGRWYEVANIASSAVLSILPAYQGPTVAAGSYGLAPMQGYVKDAADALRGLVNQFGEKLAALGTTGNYEILPVAKGGTGRSDGRIRASELAVNQAAALFNTQGMYMGWNLGSQGEGHFIVNRGAGVGGFTWRSVNSDNSATGPALTYSYDGVLNAPTGLQLAGRNIVERGSNANGEYARLADGTQICTFKARTIRTLSVATGSLFTGSQEPARSFPVAFSVAPTVQITAALEVGEGWFVGASSLLTSTTAWPAGYVFSQVSRPAQQVCVEYTAIGRWF